jgi:hypothetical protein
VTGNAEPSRDQVRKQLLDLLAGRLTREQVADWASEWIREPEPTVQDLVVWEALKQLLGADLRESPLDYLHSDADFHEWLDRVEVAGAQ